MQIWRRLQQFGDCRVSCDSGETELEEKSCGASGMKCCIAGNVIVDKKTNWTLIIILIILIILVILAIIFKNKLQILWFKFKGKAKVSPVNKPGVPPLGTERPMVDFRPSPKFSPANTQRPAMNPKMTGAGSYGKPVSEKDKEMEETLRKLKEMSK